MASRIDHERFRALLDRTVLNDRELGAALGVNQSTAWRLRRGKIQKISKYIAPLEALVGEIAAPPDRAVADLLDIARQSPALKEVLEALSRFMRESAIPPRA